MTMSRQVLRGNFQPRSVPSVEEAPPEDLTDRFEAEALRRLGGSIAFVSKKKFTLGLEGPLPSRDRSAAANGDRRAEFDR
jgi:hypothetical protein